MNKIDELKTYVQKITQNNEVDHDYNHLLRVEKHALKLSQNYSVDLDYLLFLVFLHDIEDHKLKSQYKVSDILDMLKIDDSFKARILKEVFCLSFSEYKSKDDLSLEAKIVSDADRLDAIGAIGVARAFSYGAINHRPFIGENSTIEHFQKKLLILDQYLYLEEAKELAKSKMANLKAFYEAFLTEIDQ